MKKTCKKQGADIDNTDDYYSVIDNNEHSAANRDTMLDSTATDIVFIIHMCS